ncbi:hypothetical protein C4565_01755 [Candidatus Parcubacteria bacterium]|jgi:hypothetical protein|nr:MAG: hypothetical protein C4565_01755 [Candidatus Parcubacteria bacterium]
MFYRLTIPKKPSHRRIIIGRKEKEFCSHVFHAVDEDDARQKAKEFISSARTVGILRKGRITLDEGTMFRQHFRFSRRIALRSRKKT